MSHFVYTNARRRVSSISNDSFLHVGPLQHGPTAPITGIGWNLGSGSASAASTFMREAVLAVKPGHWEDRAVSTDDHRAVSYHHRSLEVSPRRKLPKRERDLFLLLSSTTFILQQE